MGGGKDARSPPPPGSSRLFPWEAENTGVCVGVKVSFLSVIHTSRASLFPNPNRGPSQPPAFWSVPKNFTTRDSGIQSLAAP